MLDLSRQPNVFSAVCFLIKLRSCLRFELTAFILEAWRCLWFRNIFMSKSGVFSSSTINWDFYIVLGKSNITDCFTAGWVLYYRPTFDLFIFLVKSDNIIIIILENCDELGWCHLLIIMGVRMQNLLARRYSENSGYFGWCHMVMNFSSGWYGSNYRILEKSPQPVGCGPPVHPVRCPPPVPTF